ncbi:marine proteobacterial sortase target protein [Thalassotalea ganghwensis]
MTRAKKRDYFTDYRESYFYQQQRRKKRAIRFKALLMLLVLALFSGVLAYASESIKQNNLIHGPQLVFDHPNPNMRSALPVDIQASIEINGLVAYTEIKQVFLNPYDITMEGKYQFPLPEDGAVHYLKVMIGERVIVGKVMEKEAAKKAYLNAKHAGRKASLVEQQRANLFTNKIANIPPKSTIEVVIRFINAVDFQDGNFRYALPLAMTTRYQPFDQTSSPAYLNSEILSPLSSSLADSIAMVNVNLNSGVPIENIASSSHAIIVESSDKTQGAFNVSLAKHQVKADKTFIIEWRLSASELPLVSQFSEQVGEDYFTLFTFFPPNTKPEHLFARDITFIIDTSGSMQGRSIIQAKASLEQALSLLTPQDSFNIIAFNSDFEQLFAQNQLVTNRSLTVAHRFIEGLRADGGTEMYRPLQRALTMPQKQALTQQNLRQIIFITDGAVSNEFQLAKLIETTIGNSRLFTVGIGQAPNGYFMRKAAQFGRGDFVYIQHLDEVNRRMTQLMKKISQPVLTDINIYLDNMIDHNVEIYPKRIPDLYAQRPLQVAIKSSLPINSVEVVGDMSNNHWSQHLLTQTDKTASGISSLWARKKISDLLDGLITGEAPAKVKSAVLETSLRHQVLSPYTSFIAIEQDEWQSNQIAKNNLALRRDSRSITIPQTALGWQRQLIYSLIFLLLVLAWRWKAKSQYAF